MLPIARKFRAGKSCPLVFWDTSGVVSCDLWPACLMSLADKAFIHIEKCVGTRFFLPTDVIPARINKRMIKSHRRAFNL